MFHRLLVATDFTDGLHRLVKFVSDLAATGIEQIVFLHCVPFWEEGGIPRIDSERVQQAQERLAIALESVPAGVEVHVEVPSGRPTELILDTVKKYQTEVVLLGMPSRSLLSEKLFGSTTCGLAQRIQVPLLILRPQLVATYTEEELALRCRHLFRYFLIPYDDSDSARYLIEYIKTRAQSRSPHSLEACLLCWVIDKSGRRELLQLEDHFCQVETVLKTVQAELLQLGLQVTTLVRQGNPVIEIQAVAEEFDISLIAVSSREFGKFWELSIPSFTGEILRRSWHPILFIPPTKR